MRATIYLHIGVQKTGTTSIQRVLAGNREKLIAHGVNFFPGRSNQSWLVRSILAAEPHKADVNIKHHIDTPEKAQRQNEIFSRQLISWLENNNSPKLLMSAEALSRLSEEQLSQFTGILAPYAAGYRVIVYVRDPYEYANSAYLQGLKQGLALGPDRKISLPEYRRCLGRHIRVFGRKNVDIRVFNPRFFVSGDLISDFMAALELPPEVAASCQARRLNESMSHEAAVILAEINRVIPARVNGLANNARISNFHSCLTAIKGQKFSIDPQEYLACESRITADIEWLNQTIGAPVFTFTQPRPPSAPQWDEGTVQSIRNLIKKMISEFAHLQGDAPRTSLPAFPPTLEWLRPASHSTDDEPVTSSSHHYFDQQVVRDLGCFLHELARAIKQMKTQKKSAGRSRFFGWIRRKKANVPPFAD